MSQTTSKQNSSETTHRGAEGGADAAAAHLMPPVAPYLCVSDAAAAIAFYERAFGARTLSLHRSQDGKKITHASLDIGGGIVMLSDDFPEHSGKSHAPQAFGGSPVTVHLCVPDVDATWATAVAAGATVVMPLADQYWGDRYGQLRDPSGHSWSLSTPTKTG